MAIDLLTSAAIILFQKALPHLSDLAGDMAQAALEELAGEKVKEVAEAVGLLKKKVDGDVMGNALTGVLQKEPENEDALQALSGRLDKLIAQDTALKAELLARLEGVDITVGEGGAAVLGDAEQVAVGQGATQIRVTNGNVYLVHPGAFPGASTDEGREREAYLRWVMEKTGFVEPAGVDTALGEQGSRLALGAIYTALRTRSPREFEASEGAEAMLRRQAQEASPLSAVEQLDRHQRLVLLGDPGSGKSTFVAFVALCMAGSLLEDSRADLELLTSPLPEDDGTDGEDPQPWNRGPLVPVRVVLRDFVTRGLDPDATRATADDLRRFVVEELREANREGFVPHLEQALDNGEAIVLLDGLDEVPEASRRRELICEAVRSFAEAHPLSRLVVTSRPLCLPGRFPTRWLRLPGGRVGALW